MLRLNNRYHLLKEELRMALGDGIRRNVATISEEERNRLRDAILQLDGSKFYPDSVSYWDKQDEIHQATHVHGGPAFLPWHRELCNRFEALIREVDPDLSLHYWDWTTDPRASDNGAGGVTDLLTASFMGSAHGRMGSPFGSLDNNGVFAGSRDQTGNPGDPPQEVTRDFATGAPSVATIGPSFKSDAVLVASGDAHPPQDQYNRFRNALEAMHNDIHSRYIGGTIGNPHSAFEDPFVFLLHSNVDRLWACWQQAPGKSWRLDPDFVYGTEGASAAINENLEPWAGGSGLRPWAPPDNQQVVKNSKDLSVVTPPRYDACAIPLVAPQGLDKWRSVVQILFGVVNDAPGLVIGPDGKPHPVDPWGPLVSRLSPEKQDILLGLAMTEIATLVQSPTLQKGAHEAGVKVMSKSLEKMRQTKIR